MYQLICDKCYRAIEAGKDALRIEYEESKYQGGKMFLSLSSHQKGEMTLCPRCAQLVFLALGLKDEEG